jgi:molybdate transport system substrate-binding protein
MLRRALRLLAAAIPIVILPPAALGNPAVSIAAAANLVYALDALNAAFTRAAPDITLTTATGASGSLFAQIAHGAPFDVFLSADTEYPGRLVTQQLGDAATLRRFATGRLVVWTTRTDLELGDLVALVRAPSVRKIAIAQPKAAPYGRAAQAALAQLGVWSAVEPKIVFGESIAQTAQFVETGNADIGFVALSLVRSSRLGQQGRWREVPPALHAGVPLEHAVVLTTRGAANPAARRYLEFLSGDTAKEILREYGYGVP